MGNPPITASSQSWRNAPLMLQYWPVTIDDLRQALHGLSPVPIIPVASSSHLPLEPVVEEMITELVQHLHTVLFHHMEPITTLPVPIDYEAIYQMWLYFRLNHPLALAQFPEPELQEEVTYNSTSIKAYLQLYKSFYEPLFLSLLKAPYDERQLLFEFLTDDESQALMLRIKGGQLEAFKVALPPPCSDPQLPDFSDDSLSLIPINEGLRQELGLNNLLIVSLSAQNGGT